MRPAAEKKPEPSALGKLASRPVTHLLVYARERALTGTLELDDGCGDVGVVVLTGGRVVKTRVDKAAAYLGAVAYELGFLDARELDATLRELAGGKRKHGEILSARGALRGDMLAIALEEQMLRKLTHLFGMPEDATFAFYEGFDGLADWPGDGPAVDPLPAVWRGVRYAAARAHVETVLGKLGGASWRLVPSAPLVSFAFDPETAALAAALRAPTKIADFVRRAGPARALAERLVYLLALTKAIEAVDTPAPPRTTSRPTPPTVSASGTYVRTRSFDVQTPSAPAPEEPVPTRAEIALRASRIAELSLYAVLGVESTASMEEIRAAFFRLSRAWRPDRLPPDRGDVRGLCAAVHARMEEAHRTLTDSESRSRYDLFGAKEARPTTRIDAETLFREAEIALARKDRDLASALATRAHELAPDEGRYEALRVWTDSLAPSSPRKRDEEARLRELVIRLDRVLDGDPECRSALLYRARFLKSLGDEHTAHRDFARLALLDPRNIEAAREVRLYRMRNKR